MNYVTKDSGPDETKLMIPLTRESFELIFEHESMSRAHLSSGRGKLGPLNAITSTFPIRGGKEARRAGTSETIVDIFALRDNGVPE